MREIKFRAWYEEEKEMIAVERIVFEENLISGSNDKRAYIKCEFEDCKLMQYTGLKDLNGKEIYEGDIVEQTEFISDYMTRTVGKVFFEDGWWCIFDGERYNNLYNYDGYNIVLGNIYENKELLSE